MSNTTSSLNIGFHTPTGTYTKGSIDAVRIYRRELTAGEVKKIYDKGKLGYESR
jgi:hypothetical protein